MDEILTVHQAAGILKVHYTTVIRYIKSGLLKARKLGGGGKSRRHWRIYRNDLALFAGDKERVEWDEARCPVCGNLYKFVKDGYKPPTCNQFECLYKYCHNTEFYKGKGGQL